MATTNHVALPRELISPGLFSRLAYRVTEDEDTDPGTAERIVGQALAFLQACALNPGAALSPSKAVDAGWHAFILHTADYAEFCDRVAGRFIHHLPETPGERGDGAPVRTTVDAMRTAGLPVDPGLWPAEAASDCSSKCHQCHAGCYDSPSKP